MLFKTGCVEGCDFLGDMISCGCIFSCRCVFCRSVFFAGVFFLQVCFFSQSARRAKGAKVGCVWCGGMEPAYRQAGAEPDGAGRGFVLI